MRVRRYFPVARTHPSILPFNTTQQSPYSPDTVSQGTPNPLSLPPLQPPLPPPPPPPLETTHSSSARSKSTTQHSAIDPARPCTPCPRTCPPCVNLPSNCRCRPLAAAGQASAPTCARDGPPACGPPGSGPGKEGSIWKVGQAGGGPRAGRQERRITRV